jgi:hypothetical protein
VSNDRRVEKTMRKLAAVLALFVGTLAAGVVHAQSRVTGGDLRGTVVEQAGGPLAGATVTVTNLETNIARTVTSGVNGSYFVAALPPGTYSVAVAMTGFGPQKREGLVLHLGQTAALDFTLSLEGRTEEVTVVGEGSLSDAGRTAVTSVVGQAQIENLPINGRNFISFSIITPGVTTDNTPQQGASATSGLSFTGQRARSNNIMVDGLDNNDSVVGAVRSTFSQEAVREFQVLTNSYSAEFGKATGGVVNIVTKSGSNDLHGNAFMYLRDDALNAKDHFEKFDVFGGAVNREKSPFKQKQFGATLGGPIAKDRTFFFLSFERLDVEANSFVTISEPDAAVLRNAGFPVTTGANPFEVKDTLLLGKINHQWNQDHSLVLRVNYSNRDNEFIEPFGGLIARSRGAAQLRKDTSISLAETDILSPRWVHELRVQYAHENQKINSLDPNCGGPCLANDQGGPTLEVAGVASVGRQRFTPNPRINTRYQVSDTLTYAGGRHVVKGGVDFNLIDNEAALPLHFGGRFLFRPLPAIPGLIPQPLSAIQALAAGIPAAYIQGFGEPGGPYKYWDFSVFLQDEFRVSSKLVIKPGIRYQRQYLPDYDQRQVSNLGGTTFSYSYPNDGNDIAPRVAVAFDPSGDGKTSLHAAYGVFYDSQITAIGAITDEISGLSGADSVRTLAARFPSPAVLAAWRAPGHRLTEAQALALVGGSFPSLVISADPGLETPWAHQAAVGFDRTLGRDYTFTANFVYVRGKHQVGTVDYNPVVPSLGANRRPNDVAGRAGTSASVLQYTDFGQTWYKGLTVSLNKRLSHNYEFLVSYTLGKAEDNSTDFQSAFIPQDNGRGRNPSDPTGLPVGFDPLLERGPANHDQRHRFVFSGRYQLPAGLSVSSIVTAASGRPFTPITGVDVNGDGDGGAIPGSDRARVNPADASTSVGRNSANLPSTFTVDLRLQKRFKLGGTAALDVIAEAFNLLDRTNYSDVNNVFGVGAFPNAPQADAQGRVTYGTFTAAQAPRQVQVAAKVSF